MRQDAIRMHQHLGEGVRASVAGRYVIFHREINDRVEILRVIPGDWNTTRLEDRPTMSLANTGRGHGELNYVDIVLDRDHETSTVVRRVCRPETTAPACPDDYEHRFAEHDLDAYCV